MTVNIGSVVADLSAQIAGFQRDMGKAADAVAGMQAKTNRSLASMERKFDDGAAAVGRFVKGLVAVGTVVAAAEGLRRITDHALSTADALKNASERTGVAVVRLQELRFAAQRSGTDVQTLERGLSAFSSRIGQAAAGEKAMADELRKSGVQLADHGGRLRTLDQQLGDVAEAIKRAKSEQQAAAIATAAFGQAGQQLIPLLKGGRDGIADLAAEAHRLGIVLDEGAVAKGAAAKEKLEDLGRVLDAVVTKAVLENADAIKSLAQNLTDLAPRVIELAVAFGKYIGVIDKSPVEKLKALDDQLEHLLSTHLDDVGKAKKDIADLEAALSSLPDALRKKGVGVGDLAGRIVDLQMLEEGYEKTRAALLAQRAAVEASAKAQDVFGGSAAKAAEQARPLVAVVEQHIEKFEDLPTAIQETALQWAEYDKALGKSMEAVDGLRQAQDRLAQTLLEKALPPAQRYENALTDLNTLLGQGKITVAAYAVGLEEAWTAHGRGADAAADMAAETKKATDAGRDLGLVFQSAFEDAVLAGQDLRTVLQGLASDIARVVLRRTVTEPLGNAVSSLFSGGGASSAGGGSSAGRAGGGLNLGFGDIASGIGSLGSLFGGGGSAFASEAAISSIFLTDVAGLATAAPAVGGGALGAIGGALSAAAPYAAVAAIALPLIMNMFKGTPSVGQNQLTTFALAGSPWGVADDPTQQVVGRSFQGYGAVDNGASEAAAVAQARAIVRVMDDFVERFGLEIDKSIPGIADALSFTISNFLNPKDGNSGDRQQGFQTEIAGILKDKGLSSISEASASVMVEILRKGLELGAIDAGPQIQAAIRNTLAATMEALTADLEFAEAVDTLFDPKPVGAYSAAMDALEANYKEAQRRAGDLGLALGGLTASFENAANRIKGDFSDSLIRELEGNRAGGAVNTLRDIGAGIGTLRDQAVELGADMGLVSRVIDTRVKNAVRGLARETLEELIDAFAAAGTSIAGAAEILAGLTGALDDLTQGAIDSGAVARENGALMVRWLRATGRELDAALLEFDLSASDQVAALTQLGADVTLLERVLAKERLNIIQDFAARAAEAETARQAALQRAAQEAVDFLNGVRRSIGEFVSATLAGPGSPLTPLQRIDSAQADFGSQLALARGGDRDALAGITGYAGNLIGAIRDVYAGTAPQMIVDALAQLQGLPGQVRPEDLIVDAIAAAANDNADAIADQTAALEATFQGVIDAIDANASGAIDLSEFETYFADNRDHQLALERLLGDPTLFAGGDLGRIFEVLDTDGNSQITHLELIAAATGNGASGIFGTLAAIQAQKSTLDAINFTAGVLHNDLTAVYGVISAEVGATRNVLHADLVAVYGAIAALPHAAGGPAAGLTLVGEQGPEMLRLPMGSEILDNATTRAVMDGLGRPAAQRAASLPESELQGLADLLGVQIDELRKVARLLERALYRPAPARVAA